MAAFLLAVKHVMSCENEPPTDDQTLETCYRLHYGRMVSVLTRWFGVQHLDAIEDALQSAMERALHTWPQRGQPTDPAGWLYRTARHALIDHLRRQNRHARFLELQQDVEQAVAILPDWHEVSDETLRLLFLCCHPEIPIASQVAFALKIVCGFQTIEVARALLISREVAQKRIERARQKLAQKQLQLESLQHPWMKRRAESVRTVIYLIFNEGYLTTAGDTLVRQELCHEALRLGRLLANHRVGRSGASDALMALMCLHAARLATRTTHQGQMVLLDQQDRQRWDVDLISEGMNWLGRMTNDPVPSRYHLEAAIAWEHTQAANVATTNWPRLVKIYRALCRMVPGPAQYLNLAVAESRAYGAQAGLNRLQQFPTGQLPDPYPLWDSIKGELLAESGQVDAARTHWQRALNTTTNPVEQRLLQEKLDRLGPA